ncbi:hypothetical protein SS50377_22958 [Spironucleus salmonicida]|uniref:Uncharacterized protein n=1 Tax=Spironucleus salmonicida TaxID=348837 RepID=A0A9P8RZN5_9EUKA|nr:hypothetical protein SS50377_22958 [Spironucleus salmonicida]
MNSSNPFATSITPTLKSSMKSFQRPATLSLSALKKQNRAFYEDFAVQEAEKRAAKLQRQEQLQAARSQKLEDAKSLVQSEIEACEFPKRYTSQLQQQVLYRRMCEHQTLKQQRSTAVQSAAPASPAPEASDLLLSVQPPRPTIYAKKYHELNRSEFVARELEFVRLLTHSTTTISCAGGLVEGVAGRLEGLDRLEAGIDSGFAKLAEIQHLVFAEASSEATKNDDLGQIIEALAQKETSLRMTLDDLLGHISLESQLLSASLRSKLLVDSLAQLGILKASVAELRVKEEDLMRQIKDQGNDTKSRLQTPTASAAAAHHFEPSVPQSAHGVQEPALEGEMDALRLPEVIKFASYSHRLADFQDETFQKVNRQDTALVFIDFNLADMLRDIRGRIMAATSVDIAQHYDIALPQISDPGQIQVAASRTTNFNRGDSLAERVCDALVRCQKHELFRAFGQFQNFRIDKQFYDFDLEKVGLAYDLRHGLPVLREAFDLLIHSVVPPNLHFKSVIQCLECLQQASVNQTDKQSDLQQLQSLQSAARTDDSCVQALQHQICRCEESIARVRAETEAIYGFYVPLETAGLGAQELEEHIRVLQMCNQYVLKDGRHYVLNKSPLVQKVQFAAKPYRFLKEFQLDDIREQQHFLQLALANLAMGLRFASRAERDGLLADGVLQKTEILFDRSKEFLTRVSPLEVRAAKRKLAAAHRKRFEQAKNDEMVRVPRKVYREEAAEEFARPHFTKPAMARKVEGAQRETVLTRTIKEHQRQFGVEGAEEGFYD